MFVFNWPLVAGWLAGCVWGWAVGGLPGLPLSGRLMVASLVGYRVPGLACCLAAGLAALVVRCWARPSYWFAGCCFCLRVGCLCCVVGWPVCLSTPLFLDRLPAGLPCYCSACIDCCDYARICIAALCSFCACSHVRYLSWRACL